VSLRRTAARRAQAWAGTRCDPRGLGRGARLQVLHRHLPPGMGREMQPDPHLATAGGGEHSCVSRALALGGVKGSSSARRACAARGGEAGGCDAAGPLRRSARPASHGWLLAATRSHVRGGFRLRRCNFAVQKGPAPARIAPAWVRAGRPSEAPRRSPRTLQSDGRHSPHCPWMEFQEGRTCRSPPLREKLGAESARFQRVSRELEPLTSELSKARSILATVRRALCSWEVREVCSDPGGE